MSMLDKVTEAEVRDSQEVLFQFTLDEEERVMGVRDETEDSFCLIIAKNGGDDVWEIPGEMIVGCSVAVKTAERRGVLKRLLGKEAEVQSVFVSTESDEFEARLPRESAVSFVESLNECLESY